MALSFVVARVGQLMTFEAIVSHVESIIITFAHNETSHVKAYHHSFHTMCPLS